MTAGEARAVAARAAVREPAGARATRGAEVREEKAVQVGATVAGAAGFVCTATDLPRSPHTGFVHLTRLHPNWTGRLRTRSFSAEGTHQGHCISWGREDNGLIPVNLVLVEKLAA